MYSEGGLPEVVFFTASYKIFSASRLLCREKVTSIEYSFPSTLQKDEEKKLAVPRARSLLQQTLHDPL